jgi:TolB protein
MRLVALLLGSFALLAGTASASGTAKNGLVSFGACCDPVGIYVINANGTGQKRIYTPPFDDANLQTAWSRDGTRIAYVAPGGVWTMTPAGGSRTQLTKGKGDAGSPTWSADGTRIAFSDLNKSGGRRYDIYVIGSDGSGLKKIIGSASNEYSPNWSPNGKQILFDRNGSIWVASASGKNQKRLTTGSSAAWAPDGKRFAYDYKGDLWVANANGSKPHSVVTVSSGTAGIAWSPDGAWIAYGIGNRGAIQVIHPDGTGGRQLSHNGGRFNSVPAWQPKP